MRMNASKSSKHSSFISSSHLYRPSRHLYIHRSKTPSNPLLAPSLTIQIVSSLPRQNNPQKSTEPQDISCIGVGSEVECFVPETESGISKVDVDRQPPQPTERATLLDTALLISPFFFWGTSMVAMKELAPHTTPLLVAAWRLLPAGIALLAWAQSTGRKGPTSLQGWFAVALFGLVDGAFFQGFLAEGLQRTSAGLGSVIIDSQPLSVAILASLLFGERLGTAGVVGLFLGVTGLILLEVPPAVVLDYFSSASGHISSDSISAAVDTQQIAAASSVGTPPVWSIWDSGEWWMLLAAQSMAIGTVMVRWVATFCDPVAATGWHMILGGVPLLLIALNQESGAVIAHLGELTAGDVALLLYVSLLGSAASYGVFFYEATVRGNLTALSSLTFLTPMFAAAGGFLVLGETLSPLQLVGAAVTLGGVTLINSNDGGAESESEMVDDGRDS